MDVNQFDSETAEQIAERVGQNRSGQDTYSR